MKLYNGCVKYTSQTMWCSGLMVQQAMWRVSYMLCAYTTLYGNVMLSEVLYIIR